MNITVRVASAQALAQLRAIQAQTAALGSGASRAGGAFENALGARAMSPMVKLGNQLQWTGRQLQYNFTLPILLAGAAATKFALDNERAFTKIVKVYGDVGMSQQQITSETNALRKAFVALSNHFGVQQKEVLDVAAAWAAAGASGVALANDVKLTMETMILGEMNATQATDALIAIQAQYNQNTGDLTKTIQILNMVENQTGISLEGLVQGFARAAGTAAGAGVDVRHLAAMLAAMTPAAGSAAQAGNALKTILSRLFATTADSAAVMKQMGINTASTAWQSKNGSQRLETLADTFVKLNKAQQTAASSIIASRFQINKFGTLMKDIANRNKAAGDATSYYGKALESTSSRTAVYNQMQRELNQVLSSNPQRLKQIWTILQNGLADAIQPLIPVILMVADLLRRMVTWFTNLPPSVQKLIATFLVLLALFGPLLRYFGSLLTMIFEVRFAFIAIAVPIGKLFGVIGTLVGTIGGSLAKALLGLRAVLLGAGGAVLGFGGLLARLGGAFISFVMLVSGGPLRALGQIFVGGFALMGRNLAIIWSGTWVAIRAITLTGASAITDAFLIVFGRNLLSSFRTIGLGLLAIWTLSLRAIMSATRLFAISSLINFAGIFTGMRAIFAGGWTAITGAFRFGLVGLLGLLRGLPMLILRSGPALIGAMAALGRLAVIAFTNPWGAAILAVVGVIVLFRNQIAQIIQNIIQMFYQLPGGLIGALRAVVDVVRTAALQVWEWLQYLNPFARHSPSVVDNVTAGMAAVKSQINSLSSTAGPLKQAGNDLKRYGQIAANLKAQMDSAQRADDRAAIAKISPGSLGAFDQLNRDLASLNRLLGVTKGAVDAQQAVVDAWSNALDRANAALDAQKAKLDVLQAALQQQQDLLSAAKDRLSTYANTPITGMKAMSDAIFSNSMAQKKLQLQLMKMEDAVGPIDKVRSRLDKLNGEMELAQGTANDLRAKGAGSDILNVYKNQIGALAQQKKGIENTLKPYDDLQAALDKLQRTGQELDLVNSLKFDPLTRQIEQAANAMKEMPFSQIMAGIAGANADIKKYQAGVDAATAAVARQQAVVDALTKSRDAISARYDAEQKKLEQLKKAYQGVQDAIDGVKGALGDMTTSANDAIQRQEEAARKAEEARKKAAAAKKKKKGPKAKELSPAMQAFMDAGKAKDFPGVLGTGGIGREGPAGDQSKLIDDFTKDLAKQTAHMFDGFDIFGPIKQKWNEFMNWLQPKVTAIRNFLGQIFKGVDWSQPFRGMNFDWLTKLKDIVVNIVNTISWWVGKLWKLFGPDIIAIGQNLWKGLQDIWKQVQPQLAAFGELWGPLQKAIGNIWGVAGPVFKYFVAAVMGLASILLHTLSEVIGPVFEAIGGILAGFLSIVRGVFRIILALFTGDWSALWKGVVEIFSGAWKIVVALFVGIGKTLWALVKGLVEGVVNFFKWLFNEIVGHSIIPDLVNGIITWFKKLVMLPVWLATYVFNVIYTFITNWWNKSVSPKIAAIVAGIHAFFHGLSQLPGWLMTNVWTPIWSRITDWWNRTLSPKIAAIKSGIETIWHGLGSLPQWLFDHAFMPIYTKLNDVWNKYVKPLGNAMIRGFANIFNTVGQAIASGINIGIGAVNKLISGLNWIGSHVPGLSFKIGTLGTYTFSAWKPPQFAAGGGLPASKVGSGFKTNGVRAIVGEGNPAHPEFVIPTDPRYKSRSRMLLAQAAKEMGIGFDIGGVLSGIGDVAGKVKDAVVTGGSALIKGAVRKVFEPIYNAAVGMTSGIDNRMHLRDIILAPMKFLSQWGNDIDNALPKEAAFAGAGKSIGGGNGVNQSIGKVMAAAMGWVGQQWLDLKSLWNGESGWNERAMNASSGAYGIPQSLPASKMASAGMDWATNPRTQIRWGLDYIKAVYGSPSNAWGKWNQRSPHWYDNGGILRPGYTLAYNGTGKNERVLTSRQESDMAGPRVLHFHGDLSFPNVRNGNDAEGFIKNLEILAGGR